MTSQYEPGQLGLNILQGRRKRRCAERKRSTRTSATVFVPRENVTSACRVTFVLTTSCLDFDFEDSVLSAGFHYLRFKTFINWCPVELLSDRHLRGDALNVFPCVKTVNHELVKLMQGSNTKYFFLVLWKIYDSISLWLLIVFLLVAVTLQVVTTAMLHLFKTVNTPVSDSNSLQDCSNFTDPSGRNLFVFPYEERFRTSYVADFHK